MKIEDAKKAIENCDGLLKEIEAMYWDLIKISSERYDVINKQAVTILSMRNCGNCSATDDKSGSSRVCVDCHGFEDVEPNVKKSYLANWKPGKQVVK